MWDKRLSYIVSKFQNFLLWLKFEASELILMKTGNIASIYASPCTLRFEEVFSLRIIFYSNICIWQWCVEVKTYLKSYPILDFRGCKGLVTAQFFADYDRLLEYKNHTLSDFWSLDLFFHCSFYLIGTKCFSSQK